MLLKLLNNSSLTVEQKEFATRYADNKAFIDLLNNPNIDVKEMLENLVLFEASNKSLILKTAINIADNKFSDIITDKFKELDKDNRDINIQGNRIASKLDEINITISNFSNLFSAYSQTSIELQAEELSQLVQANQYLSSIKENMSEIRQYTNAIARTKLLELEKDKYYKDIVPELTKLLPEDGQVDLVDFLKKVDKLAKNEKNSSRKKKILKAVTIVAGTAAIGVGTYYFGPAVISYLAGGITKEGATSATMAIVNTAKDVSISKKLGTTNLMSFLGRTYKQISDEIRRTEYDIKVLKENLAKYPTDIHYASRLDLLQERLKKLYEELKKATK